MLGGNKRSDRKELKKSTSHEVDLQESRYYNKPLRHRRCFQPEHFSWLTRTLDPTKVIPILLNICLPVQLHFRFLARQQKQCIIKTLTTSVCLQPDRIIYRAEALKIRFALEFSRRIRNQQKLSQSVCMKVGHVQIPIITDRYL